MTIKINTEDRWFSLYIRARDNWKCQRCGRQYKPYVAGEDNSSLAGLHNAHCFGRGSHSTRWDEDNCMALCYGCHRYIDANPDEKMELFKEKLGEDRYLAIKRSSKEPYMGWKKDRTEIAQFFKKKFEKMMGV